MTTDADRCAVHPSRPAVDLCPVCGRPRCAADAGPRPGCAACGGVVPKPKGRQPVTLRALVGAAIATSLACPVAAAIASQYVEVRFFSLAVPAGVGIGCGFAAEAGARGARGRPIQAVAMLLAVIATGYGFVFEPAGVEPGDFSVTWAPYVAALAGAYAWTAPPARRPARRSRPPRAESRR